MPPPNLQIEIKTKTIHKLGIVIKAIGSDKASNQLIPWLERLICSEETPVDDELCFVLAEEIGKNFGLLKDKTIFFNMLKKMTRIDETVV